MKKIFSFIILIGVVLSVCISGAGFLSKLESGDNIYAHSYTFKNDLNTKVLQNQILKSKTLTLSAINNLSAEQQNLFNNMSNTIKKLDEFQYDLSLYSVSETKKSASTAKVVDSLKELSASRQNLLFELDIYITKMSGNTLGDPVGTYNLMIKSIVEYLDIYNKSFKTVLDYCKSYNIGAFKENCYSLYSNSLSLLCANYEALSFKNNSLETIKMLNASLILENRNIVTSSSLVGGQWSVEADLFNNYYSNTNKLDFAKNYYSYSLSNIDISTETGSDKLAFYYLQKLLGVN